MSTICATRSRISNLTRSMWPAVWKARPDTRTPRLCVNSSGSPRKVPVKMPKRELFVHKLLNRLERVDRETLQEYLRSLADEQTLHAEILDLLEEGVLLVSSDLR